MDNELQYREADVNLHSAQAPVHEDIDNPVIIPGAFSAVKMLPDDLLLEIFVQSLHHSTASVPIQFILSTVCTRWRHLMLRSPLLWKDIQVHSNSRFNTLLFFERSFPVLVDVTFSSIQTFISSEMELHTQLSKVIRRHITRLKSFSVSVVNEKEIRPLFSEWRELDAPNLNTVHMRSVTGSGAGRWTPWEFTTSPTPYWIHTENLRVLRLDAVEFNFPPLPSLIEFTIDEFRLDREELTMLLEQCPSLETLIINSFVATYDPFEEHNQQQSSDLVSAPSLTSLAIRLASQHDERCLCALPYLVAPNLRYLEISCFWTTVSANHFSLLKKITPQSPLDKLRIQCPEIWKDDISWVSALPGTTVLEIVSFPKNEASKLQGLFNRKDSCSFIIDIYAKPRALSLDMAHLIPQLPPFAPITIHCEDKGTLPTNCTILHTPTAGLLEQSSGVDYDFDMEEYLGMEEEDEEEDIEEENFYDEQFDFYDEDEDDFREVDEFEDDDEIFNDVY